MAFEFKLPDIGEGVVEGEIVSWLVKEGDRIREDQPLVEVMTDKATVEIHSPRGGVITRRIGSEGEVVPVGAVLVVIDEQGVERLGDAAAEKPASASVHSESSASVPPPGRQAEKAPVPPSSEQRGLATPAVRKRARDLGLDLARVTGSGPGGRITERDLEAAGSTAPAAGLAEDRVPLRGLRKRIAERMARSKHYAAHFTYVEEVDATSLVRAQKEAERSPGTTGAKVTYLPYIIQAAVAALKQYPMLNASMDEERQEIILKKRWNIGVAVATDQGLVVPVVKDADRKTLPELAAEILRIAEDARHHRSRLEDLQDSTFTITSLGSLGGIMATPIINYPEVAIMGVHKIQVLPRYVDGELQPRHVMNISLSIDHRVVDGLMAAQFAAEIRSRVESIPASRSSDHV